ncbi:MAG TPA: hypothetical protein VMT18_16065, partial [Planctomycetota bacterium]|nr:hypothetical protein [Planctomycetota bacterium]
MHFELLLLTLLALPTPRAPAPQARDAAQSPPGMVLVQGGRTKIGSKVKEIEDLGMRNDTVFR